MILKRILSNLIDFLIFALTLVIITLVSGLEVNTQNSSFFYLLTFILVFVFPILILKNTLGKIITKINWQNDKGVTIKLIAKYLIYYIISAPAISIKSAILSIPFVSQNENFDSIFSLQLIAAFIITDLVFFIVSLGKFHILDYLLNINIDGKAFSKSLWYNLGFLYFFVSTIFITSLFRYRFNISDNSISNTFSPLIFKEQFPNDRFYGSEVFVLKTKEANVFTPSVPLSFLFKRDLDQKTLYLNLPKNIFDSEAERYNICVDLIYQSGLNDIFNSYQPKQTRIVLTRFQKGKFLEFYNYYYLYYYNNDSPSWGINGGVIADSVTANDYVKFVNKFKSERISILEKKFSLTFDEIIAKCKKDEQFNKRTNDSLNLIFSTLLSSNNMQIALDSSRITFNKIPFSESKLYGFMSINFPITNLEIKINFINFFNDRILEIDDNIDYLIFLRNEITDENL